MIHTKRIHAVARTLVAVFIGVALSACSASTQPVPTAQTPNPPTRQSDAVNSGSVLPEVVVSAPRLNSPRVAEETSPRAAAKRGG
jgi:hypothetical protein